MFILSACYYRLLLIHVQCLSISTCMSFFDRLAQVSVVFILFRLSSFRPTCSLHIWFQLPMFSIGLMKSIQERLKIKQKPRDIEQDWSSVLVYVPFRFLVISLYFYIQTFHVRCIAEVKMFVNKAISTTFNWDNFSAFRGMMRTWTAVQTEWARSLICRFEPQTSGVGTSEWRTRSAAIELQNRNWSTTCSYALLIMDKLYKLGSIASL